MVTGWAVMISFEDQIYLIHCRGLTAEAIHFLACEWWAAREGLPAELAEASGRQALALALGARGLLRGGPLAWPEWKSVRLQATLLQRAQVRLCWRGREGYPDKLAGRLGGTAPCWVWVAGEESRLGRTACAMVGSRQTPPPYLEAARRLGRALAEAGTPVVSGMAPGADSAAHEGALAGEGGTVAVPARGILHTELSACQRTRVHPAARMTCLALDWPQAPFSAGLAIRRNDVIAALGDGLVLVASDLKGGSAYAVRWALAHKVPLWCFESGAATPPANRHLIRQGLAQPLGLTEPAEAWLRAIRPRLEAYHAAARATREDKPLGQLNLLDPEPAD